MIRGRVAVSLGLALVPLLIECGSASQSQARGPRATKPPRPALPNGAQFYVAPTGSPSGDGSKERPWDLTTALAQPASVRPGSTIWLRGGVYGSGATIFLSRLVGSPQSPILVRQYEGERATINGGLQIGCCDKDPHPEKGAFAWFWGFEIASTIPVREGSGSGDGELASSVLVNAVDCWAPGTRLIDLVIHDARQGIGLWEEAR